MRRRAARGSINWISASGKFSGADQPNKTSSSPMGRLPPARRFAASRTAAPIGQPARPFPGGRSRTPGNRGRSWSALGAGAAVGRRVAGVELLGDLSRGGDPFAAGAGFLLPWMGESDQAGAELGACPPVRSRARGRQAVPVKHDRTRSARLETVGRFDEVRQGTTGRGPQLAAVAGGQRRGTGSSGPALLGRAIGGARSPHTGQRRLIRLRALPWSKAASSWGSTPAPAA